MAIDILSPRLLDYAQPVNTTAPLNRGLVGWWMVLPQRRGGARWLDLLHRYPGAFTNIGASSALSGWGPTTRSGGLGEIRLDGIDDYLVVPHAPPLTLGATGTLALWVKHLPGTADPFYLSKDPDALDVNCNYRLELYTNLLYLTLGNGVTAFQPNVAWTPTYGVWYHVMAVWTGTQARFLLNGRQLGSDTAQTVTPVASTATLNLGASGIADLARTLSGALDDVRIWNRALTLAEGAALYGASRRGYPQELHRRRPLWIMPLAFEPPAPLITQPGAVHNGITVLWAGTAASIPTGWTRVTSLDGVFPRGAAAATEPGGSAGSAMHSHTAAHTHSSTHTHTAPATTATTGTSTRDSGSTNPADTHTHAVSAVSNAATAIASDPGATTAQALDPPYTEVLFLRSEGTSLGFPAAMLGIWNETSALPTGWNLADGAGGRPDLRGRYLKGAVAGGNGGATGGSTTHSHTIASHTHGSTYDHGHPDVTSPATADGMVGGTVSGPQAAVATQTHTHVLTIASSSPAITGTSDAVSTASHEPPYKVQAFVHNSTGGLSWPDKLIALWTLALGSLPLNWVLCDGTNGTPDLRAFFLKGASVLGDIGTTGGATTHTHTATGHTHAVAAHTHTVSGAAGASENRTAGAVNTALSTHTHTWPVTSSNGFTSGSTTPTVDALSNLPSAVDVVFVQWQAPAPSGLQGSVNVTQGSQTATSEGDVALRSTVAVTQAAQTATSEADLALSGTVSLTQTGQTSTSEGDVALTGTVTATQGTQTLTSSGSLQQGVTGSVSLTQTAQTSTSEGDLALTGTTVLTQGTQTLTSSGSMQAAGTGSLSATQASQTPTSTARLTVRANFGLQQPSQTATSTATLVVGATLTATQVSQTLTSQGSAVSYVNGRTDFTNAMTFTLGGVVHNLGTPNLLVQMYDGSLPWAQHVQASIAVSPTAPYDVTVQFAQAQSGYLLTSAAVGAAFSKTFGPALSVTVDPAEHGFMSANLLVYVFDTTGAAFPVAARVNQSTYAVQVDFLQTFTGRIVVAQVTGATAPPHAAKTFPVSTTWSFPQAEHGRSTPALCIQTYDASTPPQALVAGVVIDPVTYDVTLTWQQAVAGRLVLGGGIPVTFVNGRTDFTGAQAFTVYGSTHNLGTRNLLVQLYDAATPWAEQIQGAITVDPGTFNIMVGFAQTQSGYLLASATVHPAYSASFNVAAGQAATVAGSAHGLATPNLLVRAYDTNGVQLPGRIRVHQSTYDVEATFTQAQSGTLIIASAVPAGAPTNPATTFSSVTTVTLPAATHALGSAAILAQLYDTAGVLFQAPLTVNPSTYDVTATFLQAQSGLLVAGGGGVVTHTGTVGLTQGSQTATSEGDLALAGTLTAIQAAQAVTSEGDVALKGTVGLTQAGQTPTSEGDLALTGMVSVTQGVQTLTSSGNVQQGATGTVSLTQAAQTATSEGDLALTATTALTQAGQTLTSTGSAAAAGTVSLTQASHTAASEGDLALQATTVVTQAAQTSTSTGLHALSATVSLTQGNQALTSTGATAAAGTVALTQASQTATSEGDLALAATSALTQAAQTASSTGFHALSGTVGLTQASQTLTSTGSAQAAGTVSLTQDAQAATSEGDLALKATAAVTQGPHTSTSTGLHALSGTVSVTQGTQTLTSTGGIAATGTVSATQAPQTLTSAATVLAGGTVDVTQGAQTATSEGDLALRATASPTQDPQTSTALGLHALNATVSLTQISQTLTSTGGLAATGVVTATQASQTATGIATLALSATTSLTQSQTLTSVAPLLIQGTGTLTHATQTAAGTGGLAIQAMGTLAHATQVATSTGGAGLQATASLVATQAASGTATVALAATGALTVFTGVNSTGILTTTATASLVHALQTASSAAALVVGATADLVPSHAVGSAGALALVASGSVVTGQTLYSTAGAGVQSTADLVQAAQAVSSAGTSPRTATAAVTLTQAVTSAAITLTTGTAGLILDTQTVTSTALLPVLASAPLTHDSQTASGAATVLLQSMAHLVQPQTVDALGAHDLVGTGTLVQTQAVASSAALTLQATADLATLQTLSSAGASTLNATAALLHDGYVVSSTGSAPRQAQAPLMHEAQAVSSASVILIQSIAPLVLTQTVQADGIHVHTGTADLLQTDQASTSTATLALQGSTTLSQADQLLTSTGAETITTTGTASLVQDAQTLASTGNQGIQGTVALTQAAQTLTSTGGAPQVPIRITGQPGSLRPSGSAAVNGAGLRPSGKPQLVGLLSDSEGNGS